MSAIVEPERRVRVFLGIYQVEAVELSRMTALRQSSFWKTCAWLDRV
jgi:hypothetical protein